MFQNCVLWRAVYNQGTSQSIGDYEQIAASIYANIQPVSDEMQEFYLTRGTTVTHILSTCNFQTYLREDIFQWFDNQGNEHQYHLVAVPLNVDNRGTYLQCPVEEYPEGSKKRLSVEEYNG